MAKGKRLKKDLEGHQKVGIDTGVLLRHFEGGRFSEVTSLLLQRIQDGDVSGVVCALTVAEVLAKPLEMGLESLADLYRVFFHEMPNLEVAPVDQENAADAASLSAEYGLGMADSLVLAAVRSAGASAFATNNQKLKAVKSLQVLVLDEYL